MTLDQKVIRLVRKINKGNTIQYVNYDTMPPGTYDKDQAAELRDRMASNAKHIEYLQSVVSEIKAFAPELDAKVCNGPNDSADNISVRVTMQWSDGDHVMYTAPNMFNASSWDYEIYDENSEEPRRGKFMVGPRRWPQLIADLIIVETQKF